MKSALIAAGMAMSFGLLFAGGNVSPVAPISEPGANCYPDAGNWHHAMNYCKRLPTSDELQHVHRIPGLDILEDGIFGRLHLHQQENNISRYEHKSKRSNYVRCVRCTASDGQAQ